METIFYRKCNVCGKDMKYKSKKSFLFCEKRNTICRSCSTKLYAKRIGDASFLLNETNESFYWIGFILADGNINNSRLKITLKYSDKGHLEILSNLLKINVKDKICKLNGKEYPQVSLDIMHTEVLKFLSEKYSINSNKTLYPPNIDYFKRLTEEQLFSLFVGYVDGDGSIGKQYKRNDATIRIKVHSSWFKFLNFINETLDLKGTLKINNKGYTLLSISNFQTCKKIKKDMLSLNISFMDRKWKNIDLNY